MTTINDDTKNPLVIDSSGTLNPFSAVTVDDPNPLTDAETVSITLSSGTIDFVGGGAITDPNTGIVSTPFLIKVTPTSPAPGVFMEAGLIAGNPDFATQLLSRLTYTAPTLEDGQSEQITATIAVTDTAPTPSNPFPTGPIPFNIINPIVPLQTVTDPTPVTIDVVTAPGISAPNQLNDQDAPLALFANSSITDTDFNNTGTVFAAITVTDESSSSATDADGTLSASPLVSSPLLTKTGVGTYTLSEASPAALTTALQGLTFTPDETGISTNFTVSVTDVEANLTNTGTVIVATPGAPLTVSSFPTSQTVAADGTIDLFSGVVVSDPNVSPEISATVTLSSDANGILSGAGLSPTGASDQYTLTANSPAVFNQELDALAFIPSPIPSGQPSVSTSFTLNVSDNHGGAGSASTNITTNPLPAGDNFLIVDATTGTNYYSAGQPYTGPVAGIQTQFIVNSADVLNITAETPNVYINDSPPLPAGSSPAIEGGINVSMANSSTTDVLDGYANSNFYTGSTTADDQFYEDDRTATQNSWSTIVNFHSGDNITVFGVSQQDFALDWIGDTQGAAGYTGLTGVLVPAASGAPEVGLTIAGFTNAAVTNGALTISYGTEPTTNGVAGANYLTIHAN